MMKLILIATILSLALANSLYLRAPGLMTPMSDAAPASIDAYMTAFFAHFDLEKPQQILNCFDDKSAALYFKNVYQVATLVQDSEARNRIQVHADWIKLALLHKALVQVDGCIGKTEDLSRLLKALGAEERNPELFELANFIYYQANIGKLSASLPQVTAALTSNNFTAAGDLAAAIVNNTSEDIQSTGLATQALNALWNGVHIGLGLGDAQSVFSCWNNDTATIRLDFIYGLAAAVAKGDKRDAATNTEQYYEDAGKALLAKIPKETWTCWGGSDDTKAESQKLNIDITSQEFYGRVKQFVHRKPAAYWTFQKGIKESMEQHNFLHAGSAYAHLLQACAATTN